MMLCHPQCDYLRSGVLQWLFVQFGMCFIWLVLALDIILPFQILVFLERRVEMLQGRIEFFCIVQVQRHWDKVPLCLSAALRGKLSVRVTHSLNKLNFSYRSNGCFQDKNEMVKAEIADFWESDYNRLEWKNVFSKAILFVQTDQEK